MNYRVIDMENDARRAHFALFRGMKNPYLSLTVNCDITSAYRTIRQKGYPVFLTLLYCVANAANCVAELRRRIVGQQVIEYEACTASHTVALPNGTYCYCALDCAKPLESFLPYALAEVEKAKANPNIDDGDAVDTLFFISALPWISFTSLSHPVSDPPDSNPRITMGKFFAQDGKMLLPLNLTAHHALADGLHFARFFAAFEQLAAEIE
ncbi:MAG: chloramphenicol acetyltransferase [Oscillospiraceae bacterium]|jgi:chloramphenicol O-acetyltransferase type A|nr:chloramphenicol acetyltransferase [Oscillospiraceae bacterium]